MEFNTEQVDLLSQGGYYGQKSNVIKATNREEILNAYTYAKENKLRLTFIGGKKSIGDQFIPTSNSIGLDISSLDRGATLLEKNEDGTKWVQVGGGTTFLDLKNIFPNFRTNNPPTTDLVTLAGALAACTHSSGGFLADTVRAFSVIAPNGKIVRCEREGANKDLFFSTIGSFGAVGAITDIEIKLFPAPSNFGYKIHVVYTGAYSKGKHFEALDNVYKNDRFKAGNGMFIYGKRGHTIVLGDEMQGLHDQPNGQVALLTDNNIEQHSVLQGLANRFPWVARMVVSNAYSAGATLWAPWYGFQFFQRGFCRAPEILSGKSLKLNMLRSIGVRPTLPFVHQTFFVLQEDLPQALELYWKTLDEFPGLEKIAEQLDLIYIPASNYPAHTIGKTTSSLGVLTASFAIPKESKEAERAVQFFKEVSKRGFEQIKNFRVSLCKQVHVPKDTFQKMTAEYRAAVAVAKSQLDPDNILTSAHLEKIFGEV